MNTFREYIAEGNFDIEYITEGKFNTKEEICMLQGEGAQIAWDFMEPLSNDFGLYAKNATPDEYLEKMTNKQINELYKKIKKYIGKK